MSAQTTIRIALDWTPNTLHTGLFVAQHKHFYTSANLSVHLQSPDPLYSETPARQLERGAVDLAVCPSESCIAYAHAGKTPLQAIYAILQRDASAVVSTKLSRVKELEAGVYGSYAARYEDDIVRDMVRADGGDAAGMRVSGAGEAGKLDLFAAMRRGQLDATWVFMPWEGVEAEEAGVPLHVFRLEDYGIPYGYSPVIVRNAGAAAGLSEEVLRDFVRATVEGYRYAMEHVEEAVEILRPHCEPRRETAFLRKSQLAINEFCGNRLGFMEEGKWKAWTSWLESRDLLDGVTVDARQLYSNSFFDEG